MQLRFRPLEHQDLQEIVSWVYEAPYDFYDWDPDDDPRLLLDPIAQNQAAIDESCAVAGFVCFGEGGQVPGGVVAGAYDQPLVDVGLGLRPDLTGRGHGFQFVVDAVELGRTLHNSDGFRLTVAAFNTRAIRVYERAGFRPGPSVWSPSTGVLTEFLVMTLMGSACPPFGARVP